MQRFLHSSQREEQSSETRGPFVDFITPSLEGSSNYHGYSPPNGCLYLSELNPDGRTDWLDHCKSQITSSNPFDSWENGSFHIFDISMSKILVINTPHDMMNLFDKYPTIIDNQEYSFKQFIHTNQLLIQEKISIYLEVLSRIPKEKLDIVKNQPEKIIELIQSPKYKRVHIIFNNDKITVPKQGYTLNFIASMLIDLKKLYDKLSDKQMIINSYSKYRGINWLKVKENGFSGIYYSKTLIQRCVNSRSKFGPLLDRDLKTYLKWLSSDTLIVWNDDVLTKV
jgi:hypothetical protein